ncbi:MAG: helix-turn-helix transcriptional regulator [Anaerotignum sp.]|jgi:transcriptional regulator with XRE-family HTH domain|nr:helix-turn-helix transcriptional regulator [Anaerotignum sp.]
MFNDRLRATRISCGVTQQKTADALNVQLRHYQKYESGDIEPDLKRLAELAAFFNVPADFLLERDDYLQSLGVFVDVSLECPPRRPTSKKNRKSPHIQSSGNAED